MKMTQFRKSISKEKEREKQRKRYIERERLKKQIQVVEIEAPTGGGNIEPKYPVVDVEEAEFESMGPKI